MRHSRLNRQFQTGTGMLDAVLSMVLIALLSASVWAMAAPADQSSDVSQEASRLDTLSSTIASTFRGDVDYAGVTTGNSIQEGWYAPGSEPTNSPWGPFALQPATTTQPNDSWQAIYTDVPSAACIALVQREFKSSDWATIAVGGEVVTTQTVAAACTNAQTAQPGNGHGIVFTAYDGPRNGGTSGLQPLCFDHARGQTPYPVGCPQNDSAYSVAKPW